jgi:hypothetical protein
MRNGPLFDIRGFHEKALPCQAIFCSVGCGWLQLLFADQREAASLCDRLFLIRRFCFGRLTTSLAVPTSGRAPWAAVPHSQPPIRPASIRTLVELLAPVPYGVLNVCIGRCHLCAELKHPG